MQKFSQRKPGIKHVLYLCIFITINFLLLQPGPIEGTENKDGVAGRKIIPLTSPVRITAGKANLIYVSDYKLKRVVIIKLNKSNLTPIKQIRVNGFPLGLAVFKDKLIFIGNSSRNRIQVFSKNGKFQYKFPVKARRPNDIAISKKKKVYVVASKENLIKVYDLYGKYRFSFGGKGSGNGEFNFPTGIFIDEKNSEVVVSDFMNKRIQFFDMNGNWLRTFGGGWFMSVIDRPQGISIDRSGNYHIVDVQQACILIFDSQGSLIGRYGQYGKSEGELRTPLDIIIRSDGNAFVTSCLNKKIEIFSEVEK